MNVPLTRLEGGLLQVQARVLESMAEAVLMIDEQGRIELTNPAADTLLGYGPGELVGESLLVASDDSAEGFRRELETSVAQVKLHGSAPRAYTVRRKDGQAIQVETRGSGITIGNQFFMVIVGQDVTHRRQAEQALKRSEESLRVFLSLGAKLSAASSPVEAARAIYAAADLLWKWDGASLDLYSPESDRVEPVLVCDVLDGRRQEVLPAQPRAVPTPRMRRILERGAELILKSDSPMPDEFEMFGDTSRPSASKMYVPLRREGHPVGTLSIHSYTPNAYSPDDLRALQALADYCGGALDRLRAEAARRQSEELNRTILATAMEGVIALDFSADPQGAITDVNEAYVRMTGYSREELLRMRISDLEAQESREDVDRHKDLILAGPGDRFETRHRRKDGQDLHVEISACRVGAGSERRIIDFVRDITERKKAERRLTETLDLNQKMLTAATLGISAYKASGECIFANEALARIVGGSLDELLQANFRQSKAWQESGLVEMADAALVQGQASSRELFCRTRFGKSLWLDCHMASFVSNGQPHVLLMASDISERKQAEEALKLHSFVLQNMAEGVMLVGPDQRILFANPPLEATFGYEQGELIGQHVRVLNAWSSEETERFNRQVIRATNGNATWSGEYRNRRKDGTLFTSEARISAIDLGGRTHFVTVQQDVTERRRAEETMRQAERLQKSILDNIPDPAWLKDGEGRFLACNQAMGRFYGRPVETLIGKTVFDCAPRDAERMTREDQTVMRTRQSHVGEASATNAQGGVRWLESIKAPVCNERDEVVGTVGIARDVTERKQTQWLLELQRDLAVSLSLTSDLPAALKRLLEMTMRLGGVDSGAAYLLDEATGDMNMIVHEGGSAAFVKAVSHWPADGPQNRLARQGKPIFAAYRDLPIEHDAPRRREGLRASALIPLWHEQKAIGALGLGSHTTEEIPRQTQLVLEALAAQAAGAIARIRAETERHRLERQLLEITDGEQARIGQDIHDGLCQHLVSLAFDANSLARALARQRRAQAPTARRLAKLADEAITQTRQLARGLFPVRLEAEGLHSALEELARTTCDRFNVHCRFRSKGAVKVPSSIVAAHLYRIAQEAVANAVKHSRARQIWIDLKAKDGQLRLEIKDDGQGLHHKRAKGGGGMGLHIMDYRARSIGGALRVSNRARRGTEVFCCVPGPLR